MKSFKPQIIAHSNVFKLCLLLLIGINSTAKADVDIDSLRIAYDYSEDPRERIQIQIQIANAYYKLQDTDAAIFEYRKAISLIHPDSLILKGKTIERLGFAYRQKEDMQNVLNSHHLTNKMYESAGASEYLRARSFQLTGRTYYDIGQYDSAMVFYMDAKGLYERNDIVDKDYGYLLHFIGSVFKRQGDYDMACDYYDQEIAYGQKHGMKSVEAEGMYLSGLCIETSEDRLINDIKCLEIYTELENLRAQGLMYSYLAEDYLALGDFDSSIYYYDKCVSVYEETGEISLMSGVLSDYALALIDMGRYADAEHKLQKAEEIASNTGIKQHIRYWTLYETYFILRHQQGKYKEAVEYQTLMYAHRDSSRDQEHADAISEMEKIYNDEKSQSDLAMKDKEFKLQQLESKRLKEEKESETFIKYISFSALGLVLVLGIFVYMKYKESQKQKIMISAQKREMEFQKDLVEEKNKDITDSMIYASSIQKAIITSEGYLSKMFKDSFIFYKPRDIVSGDFYWAYETANGKRLLAVGDCTGHGVPGAMMSMLGTAFLNEIVIEGDNFDPAQILNKLRDHVKKALQDEGRRDGMDISIICINGDKLTFSGANLPLYILRNGELQETKGNKQPVGYVPTAEETFTNHVIEISSDDQVYLFSDGYADQFGGEKGKKYKYKTFRDKIQTLSGMSFNQQRKIIVNEFETWKGDLEQLDDVCVIGVRI